MPSSTVSLSLHGRSRRTPLLQTLKGAGIPKGAFALTIGAAIIYFAHLRVFNSLETSFHHFNSGSALIVVGALMLLHRYCHGMPFRIKGELKRRRFLKTAIDTSTRGAMLVVFGAHLLAYSRPTEELLAWVGPFMLPFCWFVIRA